MDTSLVIMAAGIGSRFGGRIKQLEPVGPSGEIIMDYSVHDAIRSGFNKIIFVIRREIENDFRKIIGNRIERVCATKGVAVAYAFQSLDGLPDGIVVPQGRTKPWGTGQAVLACKEYVQEPFAVINADDYYGKTAFRKVYEFLQEYTPKQPNRLCMAGFILKHTLSVNGAVTRGICTVDASDYLVKITETPDIIKNVDGSVSANDQTIDINAHVSMNMWGLTPDFINMIEQGFIEFFRASEADLLNAEYLLPIYIDKLLHKKIVSVKVLETHDQWFGITYQEDTAAVVSAFAKLTDQHIYSQNLFEDF